MVWCIFLGLHFGVQQVKKSFDLHLVEAGQTTHAGSFGFSQGKLWITCHKTLGPVNANKFLLIREGMFQAISNC